MNEKNQNSQQKKQKLSDSSKKQQKFCSIQQKIMFKKTNKIPLHIMTSLDILKFVQMCKIVKESAEKSKAQNLFSLYTSSICILTFILIKYLLIVNDFTRSCEAIKFSSKQTAFVVNIYSIFFCHVRFRNCLWISHTFRYKNYNKVLMLRARRNLLLDTFLYLYTLISI